MKFSRFSIIALLLFISVGCAKLGLQKPAMHPGAISNLDSWAYDILIVEQDAIGTAKAQYDSSQLPPSAKVPLNAAIDQYNIAIAAWKTYHASGQGQPALQQALDALIAAVGALEQALHRQPAGTTAPTSSLFTRSLAWAA